VLDVVQVQTDLLTQGVSCAECSDSLAPNARRGELASGSTGYWRVVVAELKADVIDPSGREVSNGTRTSAKVA